MIYLESKTLPVDVVVETEWYLLLVFWMPSIKHYPYDQSSPKMKIERIANSYEIIL